MNSRPFRCSDDQPRSRGCGGIARTWAFALCLSTLGTAAAADDPGRLFFTPAQRAQLEAARARNPMLPGPGQQAIPDGAPPPLRYDGVVMRSDGTTTRWVDGRQQRNGASVSGLKPGQIRANGKVYEPYQVLRPEPAGTARPDLKETAP